MLEIQFRTDEINVREGELMNRFMAAADVYRGLQPMIDFVVSRSVHRISAQEVGELKISELNRLFVRAILLARNATKKALDDVDAAMSPLVDEIKRQVKNPNENGDDVFDQAMVDGFDM